MRELWKGHDIPLNANRSYLSKVNAMSKISCPKCGSILQIEDDMLGTTIACGGCANEFVAAKPERRYDYEQDDWDEDQPSPRRESIDDDDYDDVDELRRRRRYRRREVAQSGYAIASLVCGIVALVSSPMAFCIIGSFISIPCAVAGIILGVIGMKPGSKGLAIGGITTAALGLVASIVLLVTYIIIVTQAVRNVPPPPTKTAPPPMRVAGDPEVLPNAQNRFKAKEVDE